MRRLLLSLCAASLLVGCSESVPTSDTRVIVLGVDGLDPDLLRERINRGMLPNFARLAESGTLADLQTSWPPQSPVSWSNFITGCNPGRHGLYDFIHVDRHNYGVLSSMSETSPVGLMLKNPLWLGYDMPLTGGAQESTRQFPAFWEVMAEADVPVYVHRMPANYPMPETTAVTFPDMGTPDLVGAASGKAFLWSEADDRQEKDSDSYYIRKVNVNRLPLEMASDGRAVLSVPLRMYGPPDTAKSIIRRKNDEIAKLGLERRKAEEAGNDARASEIGLEIAELNRVIAEEQEVFTKITAHLDYTGAEPQVTVEVEDGFSFGMARVGEWTDWVKVEFSLMHGMVAMGGYTRFLLKSAEPFELYASPIQVDPWAPAFDVSTPGDAAAELADALGSPYYTQGFPDAYKAYKSKLLTTAEFVSQSDTVFDERGRMMQIACDQLAETGGCLFFYTGSLDLRSHMLWWAQDPQHPHQENEPGSVPDPNYPEYEQQIDRIYSQVDGMLGDLLARIEEMETEGGPVELIIMSDHGFAPFRRKMHLNDWLVQEGYLVLKPGHETGMIAVTGKTPKGEVDWDSSIIDWSKSKAYVVGFNGIILNREGREPQGIVTDSEAEALLAEMRDKLMSLRDEDGTPVFTTIKTATEVFDGPMVDVAPDLQLGFNVGYGASDETAIGEITGDAVIVDNDNRWSGSHLMDPELVRGTILVRSGKTLSKDPALEDITATLYSAFSVAPPANMDGKPLF